MSITPDLSLTIDQASADYNVPPELLTSVLNTESGLNPNIGCNSSNACGIAQFIPSTAQQYGVNTSDATSSIFGAAHYLSDLYNQFGSYAKAVNAYNQGPGNVNNPVNPQYQTTYSLAQQLDAGNNSGITFSIPATDNCAVTGDCGGPSSISTNTPCPYTFGYFRGLCDKYGHLLPGVPATNAPGGNAFGKALDSTSFFSSLTDPATYQRAGLVVIGIIILLAAIFLFGFDRLANGLQK